MKKSIIFIFAAASVMLNSCGLYSKYEQQSSVDASLYGVEVEKSEIVDDSLTLGNISWREIFTDAKLQGLIEQALENNVDLKSAKLRVEEANNSLSAARLAYLPSLSLSAQGTTGGLVKGGASYNTYTIPVSAAWEVDVFGRITNQKLIAKLSLEMQKFTTQAVQTEIVAAVANLYYTISMLNAQLDIATRTEQSWQESYNTALKMMDAGMMNKAGVAQIEASLYSVRMAVINTAEALKNSENAMCSIIAIVPQSIEVGKLCGFECSRDLTIGIPLHMLSARPDVMVAEAALAASFYSTNVARSALYPTISLSGSLGWTNYFGSAILDPAQFIYNVVGNLVQPIFNRGLSRAQFKNAKAELEIAQMNFEQTLLNSGIEVNNALVALESAHSNSALYTSQVAALTTAANSTKLMMEHGSTTYLEVLTAQQTLFNAELGKVSNKFDQIHSTITLYKALGGGRF